MKNGTFSAGGTVKELKKFLETFDENMTVQFSSTVDECSFRAGWIKEGIDYESEDQRKVLVCSVEG